MTIACTLTSAELRARRAEVAAIAHRWRRSRNDNRLLFDPAAEPALRELVALEAECCPFLTLELRCGGDTLELTVTGPEEAAPIIASILS